MIGPEGGEVKHSSGARLIVPSGALATRTRLTLTAIAAPSSDALAATPLGHGYEAGPDGQTFLKPVELVLPFDPTRLPPGADATTAQVRMAPHGSNDFVALESRVDLAARTIHTWTVHFSQFVPAHDPNPVFITSPPSLPDATVGTAYSQQFAASGGVLPHTWALSTGSALPPGLTLSAGGALTGTPTIPTSFGFFVKASDSAGRSVQKAFSLTVHPAVNPVPTLSSIAPSSVPQGSATTTIALTGSGFVPTSVARWDGSPLATTFVSQTELAASIPDSLLVAPGTHQVTVFSPAPGGGSSASVDFTVTAVQQNPVPVITSVTPTFIPVTATDTQITIVGSSFLPTTSAVIGTQGLSTSYVSGTELHATIPASYLSAPGTLQIGVYNPPPGGGFSASTVGVTVGTPNPVPTLTSLSPSTITAGSATFTLTLSGTGFVSGGQVFFDSTALATTVESSTSATATVPATLVATARTANVTFVNPTPGGGASGALSFTITGPPPAG